MNNVTEKPDTPLDRNRTRRNVVRGLALLSAAAAGAAAGTTKANALSGPWTKGGLDGNKGGGGGTCFLTGTLISTSTGEKPVETLAVDDVVKSPDGTEHRVKAMSSWSATRKPGHKWNEEAAPIKIARSALAPSVPNRDLYLSANHAILVDGVLIRSGALVNGDTIVRCTDLGADTITYYHIELEVHATVSAHGTAAETYLAPGMTRCAPLGISSGRRAELASRARSALSPLYDVRTTFDRVRDRCEVRAEAMAHA